MEFAIRLSLRFHVLNWAVRYYPILQILKSEGLLADGSLLEIGSGPIGIGGFRDVPFIGCDLSFATKPKPPMFPIKASAADLPFSDRTFDVVLSSDVLEHVPPPLRSKVISEALRVAEKLVIFGFPCGDAAWESDRELLEVYRKSNRPAPEWLTEHMDARFPGPELFSGLEGWEVEQLGNDNLQFHAWLMRREMSGLFCRASKIPMRLAPAIVETALRRTDRAPYYRQMFILRRRSAASPKHSVQRPSAAAKHLVPQPEQGSGADGEAGSLE
ncbi:MAG TPA: class I SAM-dependent methyltransferase [Acidobacteriaceae bacterium]|nr:class I SAM-dependent methyltransferase [Acidobacteriaceae bacterium]